MRMRLSSPELPRRLMAALILFYGMGTGAATAIAAARSVDPSWAILSIQTGLAACIYAIGAALWGGTMPAWPAGLILTGIAALRIAAPQETTLAVSVLSLSVAGILAVVLCARAWRARQRSGG